MVNTYLWRKLSSSINYYIKDIWQDKLLRSSEDLASDYISYALSNGDNNYSYYDRQKNEFLELSVEDIAEVKRVFIERITNKKLKYKEKLEGLQEVLEENESSIDLHSTPKEENNNLTKVIKFPINKINNFS